VFAFGIWHELVAVGLAFVASAAAKWQQKSIHRHSRRRRSRSAAKRQTKYAHIVKAKGYTQKYSGCLEMQFEVFKIRELKQSY